MKSRLIILCMLFCASFYGTSPSLANTRKSLDAKNNPNYSRDVFAIGYQIGGWTLLGFEYEIRVNDLLGFNFGLGIPGGSVGLKFHTKNTKNAPFFCLNVKDGGFGLINTAGLEVGSRLPFNRSKSEGIAFHFQAGLGKILSIDEDFENTLYKGDNAPPVILTLGIGVSF